MKLYRDFEEMVKIQDHISNNCSAICPQEVTDEIIYLVFSMTIEKWTKN